METIFIIYVKYFYSIKTKYFCSISYFVQLKVKLFNLFYELKY